MNAKSGDTDMKDLCNKTNFSIPIGVSYEYLKSLPSNTKVRIVGLFTRPTTLKDTAYEYIVPLLDDLEEKSDGKVTVEYVDPNVQPSIINEIDPDSVTDIRSGNRLYQYAVCCDGKIRFVNPQADCFNFDADRWLYYEEYLPIRFVSFHDNEYPCFDEYRIS